MTLRGRPQNIRSNHAALYVGAYVGTEKKSVLTR